MSWMEGTGPIQDVSAVGIERGLSEDWYSDTGSRTEIKKGDFWDVIDNPLYEVAAGALGYDWDEWVEDAKGLVGTGPNDGAVRVRAVITPGRPEITRDNIGPNSMTSTTPAVAAEYEWMTKDEADERGLDYETGGSTTRWRNRETGEIYDQDNPPDSDHPFASLFPTPSPGDDDWEDDWEELRDWGVYNEGVAEELDGMSRWLTDIVNINDHLHPIIREGPKGEHYGIEGDIWEHYGLDQEPEPPKELEWDSYDKKMQLATVVTSNVRYNTPEGITPVDLHGD